MLTVSDVFDRVRDALGGLSGWYASAYPYEDMPSVLDGADKSHQTYSVAVPSSVPLAGRQVLSASVGTQHRTDLRVRWLYRLRVGNRDDDLQAALTAEAVLRNAVLATAKNPQLRITLAPEGATRRELPASTGPMLLGEMHFHVFHSIALAA